MKRSLSIAACAVYFSAFSMAQDNCQESRLVAVLAGGEALISDQGTYTILAQDFIDPAKWQKGEPITICHSPKLIHGNDVYLIINKKRNETLTTVPKVKAP